MEPVQKVISKVLTATQVPPTPSASVPMMVSAKFLEFDLRIGSKDQAQMERMVREAILFMRTMRSGKAVYWLSLLGNSGAGKTYIARRIWRWHQRCGHFGVRIDARDEIVYPREWCNWPKLAGDLHANAGYGRLHDLTVADFAVLDELGGERDTSGHVTDCLVRVLTARVGRWTIITSNKSLGEIQRSIDTRVSSRMVRDGSVVLDLDVEDYSLWKRSN